MFKKIKLILSLIILILLTSSAFSIDSINSEIVDNKIDTPVEIIDYSYLTPIGFICIVSLLIITSIFYKKNKNKNNN